MFGRDASRADQILIGTLLAEVVFIAALGWWERRQNF